MNAPASEASSAAESGFSLIEVALAVALGGVGVVVVLGLAGSLIRRAAEADDARTAARLIGGVQAELQSRATMIGLDSLAASLAVATDEGLSTLLGVADRAGGKLRIQPGAGLGAESDAYFLIEVRRHASGPLAWTPTGACLACDVRVSWPYRIGPGGRLVPFEDRASQSFSVALTR